jgi:hypothetical protein
MVCTCAWLPAILLVSSLVVLVSFLQFLTTVSMDLYLTNENRVLAREVTAWWFFRLWNPINITCPCNEKEKERKTSRFPCRIDPKAWDVLRKRMERRHERWRVSTLSRNWGDKHEKVSVKIAHGNRSNSLHWNREHSSNIARDRTNKQKSFSRIALAPLFGIPVTEIPVSLFGERKPLRDRACVHM